MYSFLFVSLFLLLSSLGFSYFVNKYLKIFTNVNRDKSDQAQAVDSPEKVSTSAVPTNVSMSGEQQSSVMEDPSYPVMDIESDQPNPGLSIKAEQMDVDSARFIGKQQLQNFSAGASSQRN